jgi:ABC-type Fe3+-siderophore transport system permease subunit
MTISPRCLRAAFFPAALVVAASLLMGFIGNASAQSKSIEVPAYRQLGASEAMASPGQSGADYSANAGSLSGLTLLATIPAPSVPRLGGVIQAQCTAGLTVVLDDQGGLLSPTIIVLAGPAANGGQGGSLDLAGMPHTGRIRIYSSAAGCQMAARAW